MKKIILGLTALVTISFGSDFDLRFNAAKSLAEGKRTYQEMAKYKLYIFKKRGTERSKLITMSDWYEHVINNHNSREDQIAADFEYFGKKMGGVTGVVNRNGVIYVQTKQGFTLQAFENKAAYKKHNIYNVSENINYTYDKSTSTCVSAVNYYETNLEELCLYLGNTFNDYKITGEKIQVVKYEPETRNWLSFNFYKTISTCKADN